MKPDKPVRPSMSKARRVRIFVKEDGRCYLCGDKVKIGQLFEVEHVIPWALSFDDTDDNLRIAHTVCHRSLKTGQDVARIAKAKRQGGEKGQAFRRAKRGFGLIKSRGFEKPPGYKHQWAKRPLSGKKNEKDR